MNFSLMQTAFAQTAAPGAQPSFMESIFPLVVIFVLMYFILIRPQAKKVKDQRNFIEAMKVGDEVLTSSGIIGRIKSINDRFVSLDIGSGNIKIIKEHITGAANVVDTKKA